MIWTKEKFYNNQGENFDLSKKYLPLQIWIIQMDLQMDFIQSLKMNRMVFTMTEPLEMNIMDIPTVGTMEVVRIKILITISTSTPVCPSVILCV